MELHSGWLRNQFNPFPLKWKWLIACVLVWCTQWTAEHTCHTCHLHSIITILQIETRNKPRSDTCSGPHSILSKCCSSNKGWLLLFSTFVGVANGPNKRSSVSILLNDQVSCRIKYDDVWCMCMTSRLIWVCVCVCLCRASQQCPSACTSEKQPCINRTPTDTIFSEGDTFQHMCWWMTTGWRCDFKAPNVLSPMTCACQCISSLTLGGSQVPLLPPSTVVSHVIKIGERLWYEQTAAGQVNDLAVVE